MATAAVHDALLPKPIGGTGPGALASLLAHGLLLAALTFGVSWRSRDNETFSAELWSAVPQVAAPQPVQVAPEPPAPTPAPPPPQAAPPQPTEAEIAIERAHKRKLEEERRKAEAEAEAEKKKAEADKKKREQALKAEQAREAQAAEQRLAQQREEQLRRISGMAGTATSGTGTASRDAAPSASYLGRLKKAVRDKITFPGGTTPDNAAVEIEVRATPTGIIVSHPISKSSGHREWDEAVQKAIDRLGRLPPADPGGTIPTSLVLEVRPTE